MLVPDGSQDPRRFKLTSVEDYEPLIGAESVERLLKKAEALHDLHVVNVNSTYYGGGVAEILSSLTLLMNASGIRTGWRVIQGRPISSASPRKCTTPCRAATSSSPT